MCYMTDGRAQVGVRELRQNLSVYLRRVKRGERLEVTERGRAVALLAPLSEAWT
ncbi:MAG: type II toxin-antitoxin system Phd/YefM family antitoxin, partial [Candidatus Limnocylindria bacterium]